MVVTLLVLILVMLFVSEIVLRCRMTYNHPFLPYLITKTTLPAIIPINALGIGSKEGNQFLLES